MREPAMQRTQDIDRSSLRKLLGIKAKHKATVADTINHHRRLHIVKENKKRSAQDRKRASRDYNSSHKDLMNRTDCHLPDMLDGHTGTKRLLPLALVLLVACLHLANAFNVDTQSAVIHSGPGGSYFGYSVAQHRDRGVNWLLVGAPRAQTDQAKVQQGGAVYKCAPNNARACQQIPFDTTGPSTIQLANELRQTDDKSLQYFGASLQSATENGSIVACAPKYVYFSSNLRRRDPVGTCLVSRGSFSGFLEYSPCRLNDQWGHHHLGSCQAGFSSAITKDGSRLYMGAPGSHVWQGQVFAHNLRTDLANSTSSENPRTEDDSYLGYSLAVGRFSDYPSVEAASDLAIGMPRGNDLAGKIMIVDREMRTLRNISGEQMGAYFGYSLAVADVNGDGLDDLIIGAPLFYNETLKDGHFERGRVYVALQNIRHEFRIAGRLDGHRDRARFGTAVASCGDLNRDGLQDVAVGAPYDGPEQRGAVYIYMGRRGTGLGQEPDQVIYAEDLRDGNQLRSFGFSLSGGLDQDGNQYPDLLVGDYQADRAIFLRSRPVVNVTSTLSFQPDNFNLDDKSCLLPNTSTSVSCINVQYCVRYSGLNVDSRLPFVFDIKLDTENKGAPRLFFLNNEGRSEDRNSTLLTKDVQQCKSFKAYIMRQIRDKLTPLKIDIDYNLAEQPGGDSYDYTTGQTRLRPVLNKSASNRLTRVATIQKNCGPDNVCVPDLKLTVTPNLDHYVIGSNEKLVLDFTVKNNGEDAFESMFFLNMPMAIDFIAINKTRSDYPICYGAKPDLAGVNLLTCDLGNPQTRNEVIKFSVITAPGRVPSGGQDFTFLATVNSTNPERDDSHREDNEVRIGIPIQVTTDLVLSGNSNPPRVVHNTTLANLQYRPDLRESARMIETELGPEVYHNYQLQNRGPSTINDIALNILWPTKDQNGNYLLYLVDEPQTSSNVRCRPAPGDAINPLRLRYMPGNANISSIIIQQQPGSQPVASIQSRYSLGGYSSRSKRQTPSTGVTGANAANQADQKASTVDNSILQQLDLLTCGRTICTRFECNVFDLANDEIATIKIRSRLYLDTLNKLSLQDFDISSRLVAQIKSLPYNVSTLNKPPYVYKVETQIHTTGSGMQDLPPWWLILLAILLGITLFILLAYFLKYLGFFARRRPQKGAEQEPLTPTIWNDYQYTPGDTAL